MDFFFHNLKMVWTNFFLISYFSDLIKLTNFELGRATVCGRSGRTVFFFHTLYDSSATPVLYLYK